MPDHPQIDSNWDSIGAAVEIALNMCCISALSRDIISSGHGAEKTGAGNKPGTPESDNRHLTHGENFSDMAIYKILQRRVDACEKIKAQALEQMRQIRRGHSLHTEISSEYDPPAEAPAGPADKLKKVRNGVYIVASEGEPYFAAHEAVVDKLMSPIAVNFGKKFGKYIYYDFTTSAIPIHELRQIYDEIDALIISYDSLYATLNINFPTYTALYNELARDETRIPPVSAPTSLFLQYQIDNRI